LDNTIGVAAGIGASGVVIWGNRWDENTSPQVCQMINEYVQDTLGPYIQGKMKEVQIFVSSFFRRGIEKSNYLHYILRESFFFFAVPLHSSFFSYSREK